MTGLAAGSFWSVARLLLAIVASLAGLPDFRQAMKSGRVRSTSGLIICCGERPGRFWFLALGSLSLCITSGAAAAFMLATLIWRDSP